MVKILNIYTLIYKVFKQRSFFKIFDFIYLSSKKKYYKKRFKFCWKDLSIGNVFIYYPENITIGNNVSLNDWVVLNWSGTIKIWNNVAISPFAQIHTWALKRNTTTHEHTVKSIIINNNARICSGCIILWGIEIWKWSIIAANSVLNKNVPENELRGWIPARKIKSI